MHISMGSLSKCWMIQWHDVVKLCSRSNMNNGLVWSGTDFNVGIRDTHTSFIWKNYISRTVRQSCKVLSKEQHCFMLCVVRYIADRCSDPVQFGSKIQKIRKNKNNWENLNSMETMPSGPKIQKKNENKTSK